MTPRTDFRFGAPSGDNGRERPPAPVRDGGPEEAVSVEDRAEADAASAGTTEGSAETGAAPDTTPADGSDQGGADDEDRPLDPEKLLRLASMAGQILEEARNLDHEDEGTARELAALHNRVTAQLYDALPNSLVEELKAMDLSQPFEDGVTGREVRLAYAGLIGWLGGLFQGLQAAMHMTHMQQLQHGRQNPAAMPQPGVPQATGQYL
jgi:hypothetical protein